MSYPTLNERQAACDMAVTLDGRRAKVSGYSREFAKVTIAERTGPQYSVEFAWQTVIHIIVNRNGAFKS